jgi:hypothetical protein
MGFLHQKLTKIPGKCIPYCRVWGYDMFGVRFGHFSKNGAKTFFFAARYRRSETIGLFPGSN